MTRILVLVVIFLVVRLLLDIFAPISFFVIAGLLTGVTMVESLQNVAIYHGVVRAKVSWARNIDDLGVRVLIVALVATLLDGVDGAIV